MDESKPAPPETTPETAPETVPNALPRLGPDSPADWLAAARLRLRLKNDEVEASHGKILACRGEIAAQNARIAERDAEIGALHQRLAEWEKLHSTWIGRCLALDRGIRTGRRRCSALRALIRDQGFAAFLRLILRKLLRRPGPAPATQSQQPAGELDSFTGTDIIVCVHNALADVERCLASVIRHTRVSYRLTIVDDGSDAPTRDYLIGFAAAQNARLIRNDEARGYTRAANQGMAVSGEGTVLLLNSDTIVTPGWLEKMLRALSAHPDNGIVGPLSNTASWQSIPEIESEGDWADNPLPATVGIDSFSRWLACRALGTAPPMAFLNGFCLLIDKKVIRHIGLFDEEHFGRGYGEENDYCLRARAAGFRLALADDCYVYHAQSKSYSHERRRELAQAAGEALNAKHGGAIIAAGVEACRNAPFLLGIRAMTRQLVERQQQVESGRHRFEGKRVLFILPVFGAGGGSNVILAEARAMLEMGVEVRVLNLSCHRDLFESAHPNINLPLVYTEGRDETLLLASEYDAVVATVHFTLDWILPLAQLDPAPRLAYYCQDYEPDFYPPGSLLARRAAASYSHSDCVRYFTKTGWNHQALERHGVNAKIIGASYDCDLFRPRPRQTPVPPAGPVRIAAMIRPSTPRRSPELTMRLLRSLKLARGDEVEILIFGVEADDPDFIAYPRDFGHTLLGLMSPLQMAALFNEIDIFTDFSAFQAMGLTAMEAMASGVAVIVPRSGGTDAFARHGHNALVIDTADETACIEALDQLVDDQALRERLARQAIADLPQFHPQRAAANILEYLFPEDPSPRFVVAKSSGTKKL